MSIVYHKFILKNLNLEILISIYYDIRLTQTGVKVKIQYIDNVFKNA